MITRLRLFSLAVAGLMVGSACQYSPASSTDPRYNTCNGLTATIGIGFLAQQDPPGGTIYSGTAGDDVVVVVTGPVTFNGLGGNDTICVNHIPELAAFNGPSPLVTINGGEGDDVVYNYTSFPSVMLGGNGDDILVGGSGIDTISGNGGHDLVDGGAGNDVVNGNDGADLVYGSAGNDSLFGDAGVDTMDGGLGNDTMDGGTEDDSLYGFDGDDNLNGGAGTDLVVGELGTDTCVGETVIECEL